MHWEPVGYLCYAYLFECLKLSFMFCCFPNLFYIFKTKFGIGFYVLHLNGKIFSFIMITLHLFFSVPFSESLYFGLYVINQGKKAVTLSWTVEGHNKAEKTLEVPAKSFIKHTYIISHNTTNRPLLRLQSNTSMINGRSVFFAELSVGKLHYVYVNSDSKHVKQ